MCSNKESIAKDIGSSFSQLSDEECLLFWQHEYRYVLGAFGAAPERQRMPAPS